MTLPSAQQLKNTAPALANLTAYVAASVALLTCKDLGLAQKLASLVGTSAPTELEGATTAIEHVATGVAGITFSFLPQHLNNIQDRLNYGINGDLETALRGAIALAIPELQAQLNAYYPNADSETQAAIRDLFTRLSYVDINNLDLQPEQIDTLITQNQAFFTDVLKDPFEAWDQTYTKPASFPIDFEGVVSCGFAILVTKHFHEALKDDAHKKARIAYFVFLLETNARTNAQNTQQLAIILDILQHLQALPEAVATATRQLTDACTLITQLLHDQGQQMQDMKAELLAAICERRQPDLELPNLTPNASNHYDFRFKVRFTTFLGRDLQLEQLRQFALQPNRPFSWWLMTAPGGSGKSRTALEFCLQLQQWNVYAGFLNRNAFPPADFWWHWQPAKPTCMVIDYIQADISAVAGIIHAISSRANTYGYPVRVLLLERTIRKDWWQTLIREATVEKSCYVISPTPDTMLALPPLGDDDHIRLIQQITQSKPLPYDRAELLEILLRLDPDRRPLFTFFASVALAECDDIRQWDQNQLLDHLLTREENNIWQKGTVEPVRYRKHKNLLAFATLTRGLPRPLVEKLTDTDKPILWLPNMDEWDDDELYNRMALITTETIADTNQQVELFHGLQPDILGEYFVLKTLHDLRGPRAKALLQTAWSFYPRDTFIMTEMALRDFPNFDPATAYDTLLNTLPPDDADEHTWFWWGWLWVNLCGNPIANHQPEHTLTAWYNRFQQLPASSQKLPVISIQKAITLTNLAARLRGPGLLADAQWLLTEFDALKPEQHPNVAIKKAQALFDLGNQYAEAGLLIEAKALLTEFDALKPEQHSDIAIEKARALKNLSARLHGPGLLADAQWLLDQFSPLRPEQHPDVAIKKAQALFNLGNQYAEAGLLIEAKALLTEFDALKPEQHSDIAIEKARALKNLSARLHGPGLLADAQWLLTEFDALKPEQHPNVAIKKAQALFDLGNQYAEAGLLIEAKALLTEFDALKPEQHPDVAIEKARALKNLSARLHGPGLLADAQWLLDQFSPLRSEQYPDIATEKAKTLSNLNAALIDYLEQLSDPHQIIVNVIIDHIEQIKALLTDWPMSKEIFAAYKLTIVNAPLPPATIISAALDYMRSNWQETLSDEVDHQGINLCFQKIMTIVQQEPVLYYESYLEACILLPTFPTIEDCEEQAKAAAKLIYRNMKASQQEIEEEETNYRNRASFYAYKSLRKGHQKHPQSALIQQIILEIRIDYP